LEQRKRNERDKRAQETEAQKEERCRKRREVEQLKRQNESVDQKQQ